MVRTQAGVVDVTSLIYHRWSLSTYHSSSIAGDLLYARHWDVRWEYRGEQDNSSALKEFIVREPNKKS